MVNYYVQTDADAPEPRLSITPGITGRHFLYKAAINPLPAGLVRTLVSYTRTQVQTWPLRPFQIGLMDERQLEEPARAAFRGLRALLPPILRDGAAGLVVCEQMAAHNDPDYAGYAFASVVLATGAQPYLIQLFQSQVDSTGALELASSACAMHTGDCVIFDPMTPHMVAPLRPADDQLLVMLQVEVPGGTSDKREHLLADLPPVSN